MEVPRPEHPRPDLQRQEWLNLNGGWDFEVDEEGGHAPSAPKPRNAFSRRIVVPFPPESKLSGVNVLDFMTSIWYRRKARIPPSWNGRKVLLHFGAVDYEGRVWVNGKDVGSHRGGYTPFACDVTEAVGDTEEAEIVINALDNNRTGLQPCGKQSARYESYGCHYTRVTGIWQTVWAEAVPNTFIERHAIWSDIESNRTYLKLFLSGKPSQCRVRAIASRGGSEVARSEKEGRTPSVLISLDMTDQRLWSPEEPYLYDLHVELQLPNGQSDEIVTYFGVRSIRVFQGRLLLNEGPKFLRLVLDQGYYPDGVYTAPSDYALRRDIEVSKEMGFDGARLHQKVFEPRFLYWSDALGYLVAGEFADWGANLNSPEARAAIAREWAEVVRRDLNHPSLVIWTPFNERVFEKADPDVPDFLRHIVQITRTLDPSRPIIDSSGYVHVETDIYDVHDYEQDPQIFRSHYKKFGQTGSDEDLWRHHSDKSSRYAGQPVMVSEYGGTWWRPEAPEDERSWGYGKRPSSEEEFVERYRSLTQTLLKNPKISAYCYTQLYDIEQEVNGLLTHDRRPKFRPSVIWGTNRELAAVERR